MIAFAAGICSSRTDFTTFFDAKVLVRGVPTLLQLLQVKGALPHVADPVAKDDVAKFIRDTGMWGNAAMRALVEKPVRSPLMRCNRQLVISAKLGCKAGCSAACAAATPALNGDGLHKCDETCMILAHKPNGRCVSH